MNNPMKIKVLGSGQDAGIPHVGCYCDICIKARKQMEYRRLGPSIAIFNESSCFIIDASPDFKQQMDMVGEEVKNVERKGKIPVSGILLTHAHFGHYSGLLQLGKEALNEEGIPVFCTPKMKKFLEGNLPFRLLVQNGNIDAREIQIGKECRANGLRFIPISVPHRDEIADCVGYIIISEKRFIYIPDLDYWTDEILSEIKIADLALIDGTFYSKDDISRFDEVPHPPILDTMDVIDTEHTEVLFTHINHTNAINKNGDERESVEGKGFKIAYDGMEIKI
jgi:pyrroloquinoline quinone biosynthesis protein B